MKKITILCVWALFCLNFYGAAQQKIQLNGGLKIGDLVGESFWKQKHMMYTDGKKAFTSLEQYRGKLLVLDFWATWCSACIGNFDKMIGLQQQFAGSLKILPVTFEDDDHLREFMSGNNGDKIEKLGSVIDDRTLSLLFPHRLIPHYVWIGADGRVIAITTGDNFSAGGISQAVENTKIEVAMKVDRDLDRPLFSRDDLQLDSLLYYSILTKGKLEGTGSSRIARRAGRVTRGYLFTNHSLEGLYANCFRGLDITYSEKRLQVQLASTNGYSVKGTSLPMKEWFKQNDYSFEIIVPVDRVSSLYPDMLEALNKYGPYIGVVKPVVTPCLVLVRSGKDERFAFKAGEFVNRKDSSTWEMNKVTMSFLVGRLNAEFNLGMQVIDETGYAGNISLLLSRKVNELKVLRKELSTYGLKLVWAKRPINTFVIKDKPKNDEEIR